MCRRMRCGTSASGGDLALASDYANAWRNRTWAPPVLEPGRVTPAGPPNRLTLIQPSPGYLLIVSRLSAGQTRIRAGGELR